MDGKAYLTDVTERFRDLLQQSERALAQVPRELWSRRLDPESNSLVTLMLHLAGNMLSRWTDFLTTDGEKPDRDRDAEFEDPATVDPEALRARWAAGWDALFAALAALTEADLERTVHIRSRPLSALEAIQRQLAHYAAHTGQIVFLAKHLAGPAWRTLSVPRHGSAAFNAEMRRRG
ncbi:MAG: DUF1572 family protein [Thermoanaerobaculia bacterium]